MSLDNGGSGHGFSDVMAHTIHGNLEQAAVALERCPPLAAFLHDERACWVFA